MKKNKAVKEDYEINIVIESDFILDVWLLIAFSSNTPFLPLPHVWPSWWEHPVLLPSAATGSSKYTSSPACSRPFAPVPLSCHNKSWTRLFPWLSEAIFGYAWEPILLSPESPIIWVINLFTFSWWMYGILSLNICTKFRYGAIWVAKVTTPHISRTCGQRSPL